VIVFSPRIFLAFLGQGTICRQRYVGSFTIDFYTKRLLAASGRGTNNIQSLGYRTGDSLSTATVYQLAATTGHLQAFSGIT
jgi:hypothetical protein